jgi:hypothetical protein
MPSCSDASYLSCCSRLRLFDLSRSCLILLYSMRRSSQKEAGSCWYASAGCRLVGPARCGSLLLLLLMLMLLLLLSFLVLVLWLLRVLQWVTEEMRVGRDLALCCAAAAELELLRHLSIVQPHTYSTADKDGAKHCRQVYQQSCCCCYLCGSQPGMLSRSLVLLLVQCSQTSSLLLATRLVNQDACRTTTRLKTSNFAVICHDSCTGQGFWSKMCCALHTKTGLNT